MVKRIRPDTNSPAPKANGAPDTAPNGKAEPMAIDNPNAALSASAAPTAVPFPASKRDDHALPRGPSGVPGRPATPAAQPSTDQPPRAVSLLEGSRPSSPASMLRPPVTKDLPQSPRIGAGELKSARSDESKAMPPPVNPSQTLSAQELRDSAKQVRPSERSDDKSGRGQQTLTAPASTPGRRGT